MSGKRRGAPMWLRFFCYDDCILKNFQIKKLIYYNVRNWIPAFPYSCPISILASSCAGRNFAHFEYPTMLYIGNKFFLLSCQKIKLKQNKYFQPTISYTFYIYWLLHNFLQCDTVGTNKQLNPWIRHWMT